MTFTHSLLRAWLLAAALASPAVLAAPCAGFNDVDDGDAFCPSVEWMKNRGITTGCGGSAYCPSSPLSRLAMAAFLNRLANALTPVYLGSNITWTAQNGNLTPGVTVCVAGTYAPTFPARAHGHAMATLASTQPGDADVALQFVVSTDGGTTYVPASPQQVATATGNLGSGRVTTVAVMLPPTDLAVGVSYRFALRAIRPAASATTADANGVCQVHVLIENRNPSSSPLDESAGGRS